MSFIASFPRAHHRCFLRGSGLEPFEAKEIDGQLRPAKHRQVRQYFSQYAGEFETMSREAGRERDVGVLRMAVDHKIPVGRHRVKACLVVDGWASDRWSE